MANEIFIIQFEFTYKALSINIENIMQEESLIFPERGGNCMNWILGHILDYRNRMLSILQQEILWTHETISCYKRGSIGVEEKDNFLPWQQLLNYLSDTQTLILKTLKETEFQNAKDVKNIAELLIHESYHTGQIGLLRRVLGKEGKLK